MSGEKYYKVLKNGKSLKGGSLEWSLPKGDEPGEWHEAKGVLSLRDNGLHVTKTPAAWWADGAECFEVEWDGEKIDGDNMAVVRKCRLVRMLADEDLCKLGIFRGGSHEVKSGTVAASGSACVRATGSASVAAYGSASVDAYGSVSVTAYGSASVIAFDYASVRAYDYADVRAYISASVRACDYANVTAYGSASVIVYDYASATAYDYASVAAYGSAIVIAYDYASVRAYGSTSVRAQSHSTVNTYSDSAKQNVKMKGHVVHIDRSVLPPVIRTGWTES